MQAESAVVKGEVLEVKAAENFSYLLLKTAQGEVWAAVLKGQITKGDSVTLENVSVMNNFESKTLNKTFDRILFGNVVVSNRPSTASTALGASFSASAPHAGAQPPETINNQPVAKAKGSNAKTVFEIVRDGAKLKDKVVVVRGRVVKYNPDIMGKNWIHLRDGSGNETDGSNDILVTTTGKTKLGAVVTVKGTVHTDKDFSAGYAYKVLIEEATLR